MAGFEIVDYLVLVLVILVSLGIGVSYGLKKQDTKQYTTGGGNMGILPVSLSLIVSFVSTVTIQVLSTEVRFGEMRGVPAEIYMYGVEFALNVISVWGCVLAIVTYVPLYCRLDINSVLDYLDLRFNHKAPQAIAYISGLILPIMNMGIMSFGPAAALESVTGVATWIWIFVLVGICTVYTSIGGIKAVVWTDVFLALIMLLGLFSIIVVGLIKLKDVNIWEELEARSRLTFHFSPDPRLRLNVWICIFSYATSWLGLFSLQPALQRYKSVGTERRAKQVVALTTVGIALARLAAYSAGVVMFAYYSSKGCGPLASGEIYSPNQIISYFVVDALNFPGIPGLFVAALIGASLSTISSMQNAISTVVWYNIVSHCMSDVSEVTKTLVMKITVVICGILSVLIAFVSKFVGGSLVQLLAVGVFGGPSMAMFMVGATLPFVGSWAIVISTLLSALLVCVLSVGSVLHGQTWEHPELIHESCDLLNDTAPSDSITDMAVHFQNGSISTSVNESGVRGGLFNISPFLYGTTALILCYIFSIIVCIVPAFRQKNTKAHLVFPFIATLFRLQSQEPTERLMNNALSLTKHTQQEIQTSLMKDYKSSTVNLSEGTEAKVFYHNDTSKPLKL